MYFFADETCGLLLEHAHVLYGLESDAVPITYYFDLVLIFRMLQH